MDLFDVSIAGTLRPAEGFVLLQLDPAPLAANHQKAGQYLMFQGPGDEKPKPLALATAPGRAPAEILIRAEGQKAESLLGLRPGYQVKCSAPAGPGYPVEDASGQPLLLVATGSALGPIRAALQAALELDRRPSSIRLVYGVRHEDQICFADEQRSWENQGVRITTCISRPGGEAAHQGYVQDHLGSVEAGTLAFVCGQPAMMDAVTETLGKAGVAAERVKRNF